MEIIESRNVALPNMPNVAQIITQKDKNGKRVRFINICAAPGANIIQILAPRKSEQCVDCT